MGEVVSGGVVLWFSGIALSSYSARRGRTRFPLIENGFSRMEDGDAGERRRGLKRGGCPRIYTDWHGLMGEVVSGGLCYGFQVLRCRVIQQKRKSAVPAY